MNIYDETSYSSSSFPRWTTSFRYFFQTVAQPDSEACRRFVFQPSAAVQVSQASELDVNEAGQEVATQLDL